MRSIEEMTLNQVCEELSLRRLSTIRGESYKDAMIREDELRERMRRLQVREDEIHKLNQKYEEDIMSTEQSKQTEDDKHESFEEDSNTHRGLIFGFNFQENGFPHAGWVECRNRMGDVSWTLRWQPGVLDRTGGYDQPQGAFVEDLLVACKERLKFYQKSKAFCEENAEAIEYIQKAEDILVDRRLERRMKGIEGTLKM